MQLNEFAERPEIARTFIQKAADLQSVHWGRLLTEKSYAQ